MFFIGIFGMGEKEYPSDDGSRRGCAACGSENSVKRYVSRKYFHIFFIPVWFWGERRYERCGVCGAVYDAGGGGVFGQASVPQYCRRCGKDIREFVRGDGLRDGEIRFCPYCGEKVSE